MILGRAARAIVAVAVAVQLVGGLAPAVLAAGPDRSDVALVLDFSASILKDAATRNRFVYTPSPILCSSLMVT